MARNGILAAILAAGVTMAASAQVAVQPSSPLPPPPQPTAAPCSLQPVAGTHTVPPYPDLSRRLNEQGDVTLVVTIDPHGTPTDVTVQNSSDTPRLDDAAVAWIKQTWRWMPPEGSCASGVRTLVKVTFRLKIEELLDADVTLTARKTDFPPGALQRDEAGSVYLSVHLKKHGRVASTNIVRKSSYADLDARAETLARQHRFGPRADGKPDSEPLIVRVWFPFGGVPAKALPPPG
jgi:TonB family protein